MNLLLLYPDEVLGDRVVFTADRLRAVQGRFDLKQGDCVVAGVLNGSIGVARVRSVSAAAVELDIELDRTPPERINGEFIVGLSRPQTVKKVLHFAASFGIESLRLVRCERSEKSYLDAHVLRETDLLAELDLGLAQAIDTVRPRVTIHYALEAALRAIEERPDSSQLQRYVAHTQTTPVLDVPHTAAPLCIAIGPEAGFDDQEIAFFKQHRFVPVSLGLRQLRVEFALAVLAGQMSSSLKKL